MLEFAILAVFWAGFLWVVAAAKPERMQMIWLVLVALVLVSPLMAWLWPAAR